MQRRFSRGQGGATFHDGRLIPGQQVGGGELFDHRGAEIERGPCADGGVGDLGLRPHPADPETAPPGLAHGADAGDVRTGPDGALYVMTDGATARILKLVPKK